MLKLSEKYPARPGAEFPLLFQRILQNTIRDFYRRQKVRSLWTTPVSALLGADSDDEHDPLETLQVANDSKSAETPHSHLERTQLIALIEKALQRLPPRQREAFVLRYWEELDVAEAAKIMGCSEERENALAEGNPRPCGDAGRNRGSNYESSGPRPGRRKSSAVW
jgi:RNA polymerase sigma-70 factor (ECF subfamily)